MPHWMPSPQPTVKPNLLLDWDPNITDRGHDNTRIRQGSGTTPAGSDTTATALPLPTNMDFLDLQPVVGALYMMRFRLTKGLAGDMVLLQWYCLGSQFVQAQGVYGVPVPEEWGKDVSVYPGLPD